MFRRVCNVLLFFIKRPFGQLFFIPKRFCYSCNRLCSVGFLIQETLYSVVFHTKGSFFCCFLYKRLFCCIVFHTKNRFLLFFVPETHCSVVFHMKDPFFCCFFIQETLYFILGVALLLLISTLNIAAR